MRKLVLLFLLVLSGAVLQKISAQTDANLDSLWGVWEDESRHDTLRFDALNNYVFNKFMYVDNDSALHYSFVLWELAESIGGVKEKGLAMSLLAQSYLNVWNPDSALICFEKAIAYSTESKNFKSVAAAHINRGLLYNNLGQKDNAIAEYDKGIAICEDIGETDFLLNGLNNKAVIHLNSGEYDKAIPIFKEVIKVAEENLPGSDSHKAGYVNLGFSYASKGDYARAIESYNACIRLIDKYGGAQVDVYAYNFLGSAYKTLGETENAIKYLNKAFVTADSLQNIPGMGQSLIMLGGIYQDAGDLKTARTKYLKALELETGINHRATMAQPMLKLAYLDLEENKLDSAEARFREGIGLAVEIGDLDQQASGLTGLGMLRLKQGQLKKAEEDLKEAKRIGLEIGDANVIEGASDGLFQVYNSMGRYQDALDNYMLSIQYRDSIQRDENKRAAIRQEFQYSYDKKALADSLAFAQKEAIKDLEIEKQNAKLTNQRIGLTAAGGGTILLILLALSIRRGKQRSDELLHNILPQEVATELKQNGKVQSKRIEDVTVLFTDFKGFTAISEIVTPSALVEDLNQLFSAFDLIMEKYGLEKIKTIGDAYMAAGGLNDHGKEHARKVILAAAEIRDFVEMGKQRKIEADLPYFEIRIGVHTGPVVAGVVGVKKFQYDIWGDTVNTASRMESSGEVGKINISQATYEVLKGDPELRFEERGKLEIKGKGKMEMYFVDVGKV